MDLVHCAKRVIEHVAKDGLKLVEIAPGVTEDEVREKSEPDFMV